LEFKTQGLCSQLFCLSGSKRFLKILHFIRFRELEASTRKMVDTNQSWQASCETICWTNSYE
jgi:hypothetical protein